ncbi:MAG: malto-oligosyltrehalose synthase, partial [Myxococcota bacterium]
PGLGVKAATLGYEHPAVTGLQELFALVSSLPPWTATGPDERAARHRGVREAKAFLARLVREVPEVAEQMEQNLEALAGRPGEPESFDRMDGLLSVQPYRLCFWKLATERVSYRRFFDIGSLVGVRVEDRRVFRETHELVIRLLREGKVEGLRLDHIDGLLDPRGYLRRLRRAVGKRAYIAVEKILGADEELPQDWPVEGATGYETSHVITGPFVDKRGLARLTRSWAAVPGASESFGELVYRSKKMVLETLFGGELQAVITDAVLAVERDRHGRDISPRQLGDAILAVTAALPVYRTYLQGNEMSETDKARVRSAVSAARRRQPSVDRHAYDMVERLLTLSWPHSLTPAAKRGWRRVVQRWQQLSGPAMAKGLEDTALYVDARLLALNEVGADEETIHDPADVERFHEAISERARRWPHAMTNSSTHDSKRSEDARARLLVLSEMAGEWEAAMARWSRWHRRLEREVGEKRVPDQATARSLYQNLLCVWPLDASELPVVKERTLSYLRKAAREAKVHTSWIDPDETYEEALLGFTADLFEPGVAPRFHENMEQMVPAVAFYGALNSLAMTQLKLTLPGIPDVYQGTEMWRLDLADPDNRRPVDFEHRRSVLSALDREESEDREALMERLLSSWPDGRAKLYLLSRLLRHRRAAERFWAEADYVPLRTVGSRRENIIAFARTLGDRWAVCIVPRLCMRMTTPGRFPLGEASWRRTLVRLPAEAPARFLDLLAGREVWGAAGRRGVDLEVSSVLHSFPTALLVS